MIFPSFLSKTNKTTIGICAPSAGVGHKIDSFEKSLDALKSAGFKYFETKSVRNIGEKASSAEVRAKEVNELVLNDDIGIILSASGGDYCMEVLPYINADNFLTNPKWVCGSSDPTNVVYYLTTKLDIATIYGVNAGSFDWSPLHEFQKNAIAILKGNLVEQSSFDYYDASRSWSDNISLDTKVYWETLPKAPVDVSGRLIGGCSDCISNLIGTPYDGTSDFVDKYAEEGIIWYFDPFETSSISFHLLMLKMKYAGYFRGATAIIIGRVMLPQHFGASNSSSESKINQEQPDSNETATLDNIVSSSLMNELSNDFDIPIVLNADIGHVKPSMTLINGSYAHLYVNNGKATLSMSLK